MLRGGVKIGGGGNSSGHIPIENEIGTSCEEWGMSHSIHQSVLGTTLFSCRCSLTPNTVNVSDRPAYLVSGSSPKDGFISVQCYDC